MSDAADKLGALLGEDGKRALGWGLGFASVLGMVGLLAYTMFRGDKRMYKLKKIREAAAFAADAQIPRMQLEATLVLGELANDMLKELRESREAAQASSDEYRHVQSEARTFRADAVERFHAEHAISIEIRDLLRRLAGVEPPAEPAPEVAP